MHREGRNGVRKVMSGFRGVITRLETRRAPSASRGGIPGPALGVLCALVSFFGFSGASAFGKQVHVFSSSFGSAGSGAGQLLEPLGVAVNDATGKVYVVDKGNARVDEFASDGTFVRAWGWGVADGISEEPQTCTLACFKGIAGSGAGQFSAPEAIAIDNSGSVTDPSKEDVYVTNTGSNAVLKFDSTGTYLGEIAEGENGASFGQLLGVAVDPRGQVWVDHLPAFEADQGVIDAFSNGQPNLFASTRHYGEGEGGTAWLPKFPSPGFAVDATGNSYVFHDLNEGTGSFITGVAKVDYTGRLVEPPGQTLGGTFARSKREGAVAVDPATDDVYLDEGTSVLAFSSSGAPLETFGAGHFQASTGVAIDAASETGSVTDSHNSAVVVFTSILVPDTTTGAAGALESEGAARLHGTVNPDGVALKSGAEGCRFEYATEAEYAATGAYGQTAACAEPDASEIGSASAPVAVHANISVTPNTNYRYRLVTANENGQSQGEGKAFTAPAHPVVAGESVGSVSSTEASVSGQVTPGGLVTDFYVEYGTSTAYGSATPHVGAGAGVGEAANERVQLSGLQPGTVYHARLVASNAFGRFTGNDISFTTGSVGVSTSALPDGRAYELVSTANTTDVYAPLPSTGAVFGTEITTERPMRASASGEAVAYLAEPPSSQGSGSQGAGGGDEYLAKRAPGGWQGADLVPPGIPGQDRYISFSSDLSAAIFDTEDQHGTRIAGAAQCDPFAILEAGQLRPFFTEQLPVAGCPHGFEGQQDQSPRFAGSSADYSHLLFESQAALTAGAQTSNGHNHFNLYDVAGGRVRLVYVAAGSVPSPAPDATFGGPHNGVGAFNNPASFDNAISEDGSRIFWTDLDTFELYLRLDNSRTVAISAGESRFWTATPDGQYAYYTEGEEVASRLWRFN